MDAYRMHGWEVDESGSAAGIGAGNSAWQRAGALTAKAAR